MNQGKLEVVKQEMARVNKDLEELRNKYAQTAQFHEQYEKVKR